MPQPSAELTWYKHSPSPARRLITSSPLETWKRDEKLSMLTFSFKSEGTGKIKQRLGNDAFQEFRKTGLLLVPVSQGFAPTPWALGHLDSSAHKAARRLAGSVTCNVLLIFYFNCKQSWNVIEHIMLDTAEVIKVRGPHAVVSKTPDVSSLEKMSLIQHQWGREEKRQGWDDQQQIPLKLQQHDYSVQRKAAKGWIAVEL